jgi:epoxyqueuosine reductase QueG
MADLTDRIKALALGNDLDYCRIAPVTRFDNAPEGHHPTALLPRAASVISMGIRYSLGVLLSHRIGMRNRKLRHVAFAYRWFGYGLMNMYFMDRAAFLVTQLLEEEGHVALPIVASGVEASSKPFSPPFSNRHAAVAAGIGEFGWNGLCVTPEAGPRNRFVSVITTAELDPDPLYDGPKLCDLDKCRELGKGKLICEKVCPVQAFKPKGSQSLIIGGKEFRYGLLEKVKCVAPGYQYNKKSLGLEDIRLPKKYDATTYRAVLEKLHPQQKMEASFYYRRSHGCGLCLLLCPIAASKALDEELKQVPRPKAERR